MALKIQDLIDIEQFQLLQDRLNEIYSFPSAIIDNEGKVLTATAWQDICTKFHRQNSECEKECIKSDQYIADHLHEAHPAVSYRCPHGLIDNATPIIIEGVHYGNFFTGQFFLEPPDLNFFRSQANRYGFDEEAYIEAVKKVPIWTQEQLNSYLFFIKGLIEVIAGIGLKNLKEIEARKSIQESEDRHRTILQTAMDGIWRVDLQGRLLEVNEAYCRMSGYGVQELLAMHIPDLEASETEANTAAHIQKVMAQGEDRFESRHRRKDGTILDVEVSVQYQPNDGGELLVFLRDITERKRTENALYQAHKQLTSLFNGARDAIFIVDILSGLILDANDEAAILLNRSRETIIGFHHSQLHPPEKADFHRKRFLDRSQMPNPDLVEAEVLTSDDRRIPVEISARSFELSDSKRAMVAIFRDITERKRAEEESNRYSRQLAMLHETSVELMAERNLEALLQSIARRALDLIGGTTSNVYIYRPEEDLMDRVVCVGPMLIPSKTTRRRGEGMVGQTWAKGAPMLINDYHAWPGRTKAIDSYPSRALIAVPFCQGTEILGIINIMANLPHQYTQADIDILSMFAAQASIAIQNAQLYDRIKLELAERKRAEEERRSLEERLQRAEKMEALGQLAGGVAHDLNNVLGILSGYSELLLMEIPEGHRSKGYAEKILQSTEKAAAIIQDLLTLARRGVTASDVINLNGVVSSFLKTPVFEKMKDYNPRVTFRTECDKNLLNIKGSPVHLEKTLMNLVANAAESISEKGEVTIRTESRYVDKAIQGYDEVKEGDYAVLTVSDTGMGIPAEEREKIFEPFYTKKTMGRSGTGLGLAIVWGTVKDHNGYIDVQSEVGQGTTFTLYFPVTREEAISKQQKMPMERYMGKGESVLVVDDVAEQRDIAAGLLKRLGYQVHVVSSGEEALEYLKGKKVDILVLDMIMPLGMDGLETYQRVLEFNPKQKAIIVSGFSETKRVRETQKLGAGAYVKKPYLLEKIGIAIRNELNG